LRKSDLLQVVIRSLLQVVQTICSKLVDNKSWQVW
jgi:hypothetical protein